MGTLRRKSLPLSPEVLDVLDRIRTPGTDEAEAASDLVGVDTTQASEAQTLAAVFDLGRRLVEERAREESYRRLAAIDAAADDRDQERTTFLARRAERERRRAAEDLAIDDGERNAA